MTSHGTFWWTTPPPPTSTPTNRPPDPRVSQWSCFKSNEGNVCLVHKESVSIDSIVWMQQHSSTRMYRHSRQQISPLSTSRHAKIIIFWRSDLDLWRMAPNDFELRALSLPVFVPNWRKKFIQWAWSHHVHTIHWEGSGWQIIKCGMELFIHS